MRKIHLVSSGPMRDTPRLFLITPPIANAAHFAPLLETAMAAVDVACVLLRTAARDEGETKAIVRILAPLVQSKDAALLVETDPRLAARADADGVHMHAIGENLAEALAALQPKKIVGVGPIAGRDAAMAAGEAGVDYLMFGGPDGLDDHETIVERVGWWASIFNVPCVGYARTPDLAADIATCGAEFVALCDGLWDADSGISAVLTDVSRAIAAVALADEPVS